MSRSFFSLIISLVGIFSQSMVFSMSHSDDVYFCGDVRVNMIKGWDKLLSWTLGSSLKPYFLATPLSEKIFEPRMISLDRFNHEHGYFSSEEPIVGIVTNDLEHITITNQALRSLSQIQDKRVRDFVQDELLAKVMAYRKLVKGMHITLYDQVYLVDVVFDLWHGMPAFGLVPESNKEHPPILLFRGTDLNLVSEKGWASILSDLDWKGPGYETFLQARDSIHNWLKKVQKEYAPARLIGYSLGGAFVFYTIVFEGELVHQQALSVAFNPPGISQETLARAKGQNKIPLKVYVNKGDIVSQIGFFPPSMEQISVDKEMGIIEAHVSLISAEPKFTLTAIDAEGENQSRK